MNYCNCPNCQTDNCPNAQWKEEDQCMLREQIRVADKAYNWLHDEHQKLRQALRLIADGSHPMPTDRHGWDWMIKIAREALGEQEQPTTKKETHGNNAGTV